MSYVLGFGGQKGGTGKTILATSTAVRVAQDGAKVILYDLDFTQKSAVDWSSRRKEQGNNDPDIEVISTPRSAIPASLNGEDVSILDLPGFADDKTASIALHCNLFILPTGTGYTDLDATIRVAHELIREGIAKDLLYFAITKAPDEKEAIAARTYIQGAGYNVLKGYSRFAKSVEHAQNKGLGLTELSHLKLKNEAQELIEDIGVQLTRERTINSKIKQNEGRE